MHTNHLPDLTRIHHTELIADAERRRLAPRHRRLRRDVRRTATTGR